MSLNSILNNPALKDKKELELNEEWNNFMKKIGEVTTIVKDMSSGDKEKAAAAQTLADMYLKETVILDEDLVLKVKANRTVINQKAFDKPENKDANEMDKETWMAEMSKDAERRTLDRKIRKEKADTLKTLAVKAFRREEYEKALSYYNKAIDQVKDNAMLYCDRALTFIKLRKFEQVFHDCDLAIRLNENSFKARLYQAKAYKEMEELDKLEASRKELEEMFPQHQELITYFLEKKEESDDEDEA